MAEGLKFDAIVFSNATLSDETIRGTLDKQHFINTTLTNVSFSSVHFRGVSYAGSSFKACSFQNVLSEATSFRQCIFVDTIFENTDLQLWQFSDSEFVNSTFRGVGRGCAVDVPFAPATAYLQIMFGHSGGLVGLILSVFISKLIETRLLFSK